QLNTQVEASDLILIDLGESCNNLAGSALAQVFQLVGDLPPDVDNPQLLKNFFHLMQKLHQENLVLAYHDRSDGGLFVTLCEMAFAGRSGFTVQLDDLGPDAIASLFSEELGAVIQVRSEQRARVLQWCEQFGLAKCSFTIGKLNRNDTL